MNIIGLHGALKVTANSSWSNPVAKSYPIARAFTNPDESPAVDNVHDAGCTLFVDGKHIRSVDEERLTRKKYEGRFPSSAIDYCLGDLSREDIDIVCYAPSGVDDCNHQLINHLCNFVQSSPPQTVIQYRSSHLEKK